MGHSKVLTVKQFAKAQENHCQTKALFVRLRVKALLLLSAVHSGQQLTK